MVKLHSLEVQNFKSLVNTSITIFGDVNMFFGYNNSGKSNIFKFLVLLFEKKKIIDRVNFSDEGNARNLSDTLVSTTNFWNGTIFNEPFVFTKNNRAQPITFTVTLILSNDVFPDNELLTQNEFLAAEQTFLKLVGNIQTTSISSSELRVTEAFLNERQFLKVEDGLDVFFENLDQISSRTGELIMASLNDLVLFIDSDRNFKIETFKDGANQIDINNFKNGLHELFMNADKNEEFNQLIAFLSKFRFSEAAQQKLGNNLNSFPFTNQTRLGFTRFGKEIELMLTNSTGNFPLKNYGTGIQQFLYLLTKIYFSKCRIVIIEEVELNLSPLYQKEIISFLKQMIPVQFDQLIFSSHSPYFVQKNPIDVDVVHQVKIDYTPAGGTFIDSHDDLSEFIDPKTGDFLLSDFFE